MNRKINGLVSLLVTCLVIASIPACDRERSGSEARSTATGERDERLGNDPAEQNTGRGSNPSEEVPPNQAPQ